MPDAPRPDASTPLPGAFLDRPLAHRGLHDRAARIVENSPSAFRAAVAAGYGIELDVQGSRDGEAMVFHDASLDRLTEERGPVREREAAALRGIELSGGGGDRIPTLAEALAVIGADAPVLVEIKRQTPAPGREGALEAAVAAALAGHRGPAAVMSFDPRAVLRMRDLAPGIARGLVSMDHEKDDESAGMAPEARRALSDLAAFDSAQAGFVSYNWRDLPRPAVQALRARGVPILCWTTRSPADDAAARRHVDNVTFEGYRPAVP